MLTRDRSEPRKGALRGVVPVAWKPAPGSVFRTDKEGEEGGEQWMCPGEQWMCPGEQWMCPGGRWMSPGGRWMTTVDEDDLLDIRLLWIRKACEPMASCGL